jgi:phage baseplate assembly protein gpV
MTDLVALVQSIVQDSLQGFRTAELGVVSAIYSHESSGDKNNYECDVKLRDSGLELKRVSIATHRVGAVAIPNVNDLVLVQFLNGDVNSAIVTGRLHTDQARSPEAKAHEDVYVSPDADESGVRRLYLELPKSNKLTLEDDKVVLEMGRTTLTIENDGKVEIKTNDKDVTVSDSSANNALKLEIQSGQATLKGQMKVVVDGPQIELTSGATHALVLGDQLLTYLNQVVTTFQSHMHPGEMALGTFPVTPAPPVPPLPPATPDLLSLKVKTG